MIFRQLFDAESWTYTYLLGDTQTGEAVYIDPVNTHVDEYLQLLQHLGLNLKYALETHVHADHITASGLLRQRTGAATGVGQACGAAQANLQLNDGDIVRFGAGQQIKVIATPGHTPGSVSFLWQDRVFTGDALLINGCGRTDFQGGNAGHLYDCITQRLFSLPGETLVYPGHDYQGRRVSSIDQERLTNARLAGKTRDEFIAIMAALDLPKPRLIDAAVPANRRCGLTEEESRQDSVAEGAPPTSSDSRVVSFPDMVREAKAQIREVEVDDAKVRVDDPTWHIVDVREPDEFAAGHLPRAVNLPRGVLELRLSNLPELANPSAPILLYCRSGGRAALAAVSLQRLGYTRVESIRGGYEAWQAAAQS